MRKVGNVPRIIGGGVQGVILGAERGSWSSLSEAGRASGVSRRTVYAWIKRGLAFQHQILESPVAIEMARKIETNIPARLGFGAIAQIWSNDEIPAGVRARAALAVFERGNIDSSAWGVPDPAVAAEARTLDNFTPHLAIHLTAATPAAGHLVQKPDGKQEGNIVYTAA